MSTTRTLTPDVAVPLVAGGILTCVAGLGVQVAVVPTSQVPADQFSHPWTPEMLVPVSLVYALFHGLVAWGLAQVVRPHRGAVRAGLWIAIVATGLLLVGELASIAVRDRPMDDPVVGVVTGVLFGLGMLGSAVGFLVAGIAACRRSRTPFAIAVLVAGVWSVLLPALILTPLMTAAIGVYGATLAAVGWTHRGAPAAEQGSGR